MMKVFAIVLMLLPVDVLSSELQPSLTSYEYTDMEDVAGEALRAVLEAASQPTCSLILLTDGDTSHSNIVKAVSSERASPRGVTVMEVTADGQEDNVTLEHLSHLYGQARQVRLGSWCVSVVVVSHDLAFLVAFAESSLKGRLLVWATRLLVVTRLNLPQLYDLLTSYWTFSMMNAILLNLDSPQGLRVTLYTYLPYSPDGAQVIRLAFWTPERGLLLLTTHQLFREKFKDFHGATVPVTVLPFPPYWVEEDIQSANGTTVRIYTGTDGELLHAVARALNFVFFVLPTANWGEVEKKVEDRESFISTVYYTVLPQRLERFDMTFAYEYVSPVFSMRKPGLKPSWQSLYYPMADQVWAAVLALLICVPAIFTMIIRVGERRDGGSTIGAVSVVLNMTGMLLGQNLPRRLPRISSSRLLVASWLVFSFIMGTVYRGNLTAHLTLPKYPPRPETVEQLVEAVDRVTRPPYGAAYKEFFMNSDYDVFRKLGELFLIGPSVMEGLQQALDNNQAVIESRRYMENIIAENFTRPDGGSDLYIGRDHILPGLAAWPIPHDAPYRPQLDRCLMAVIEAGLYEKWSSDQLAKARRRSSRRQREQQQQQREQQQLQQGQEEGTASHTNIMALTLTHMQGPLMLVLLGLFLAGLSFSIEILVRLYFIFE